MQTSLGSAVLLAMPCSLYAAVEEPPARQPNILFIMADDHAAHAISAYGSRINSTPQIDRLAAGGMRLNHCYCTNSICTPSRAAILTGQFSQKNGVYTLADKLDTTREYLLSKQMQLAGYQTAIVGKWHLGSGEGHDPTGFDYWCVLPGQGKYHDPDMIEMGITRQHKGYVSQIITDQCLDWLRQRDKSRPFFLMCHHKAPHRRWEPGEKYQHLYEDVEIPEPATFNDDYATRCPAASEARMRIDRDLKPSDYKLPIPPGLTDAQRKSWLYQCYIKDYLRCVASVDDSVGQLLDELDAEGITDDTIVVYTSDQGFFLGDHDWFDKRFMYEPSLRMPFIIRYPREIKPGSVSDDMLTNCDFAPTFLDYAGRAAPAEMQGVSARAMLRGQTPDDWQKTIYYRYWMHLDPSHGVWAHYGVRSSDYKLIYFYGQALGMKGTTNENRGPCWELYDLNQDPDELVNVYGDPAYAAARDAMTAELDRLQAKFGDKSLHHQP